MFRWSPGDKARLGITKQFLASTDIGEEGEEAARKLCEPLLDDSHYDLLLNEHGLVETTDFEPLCVLFKNVLPKDLLNAVRPVIRKAAHRKIATGNRGVAAGTGIQPRRREDGTVGKIKDVPLLEDLNEQDYKRIGGAREGTFGFSARSIRGGQVYPCRITYYSGALPSEPGLMSKLAAAGANVFGKSGNDGSVGGSV